MPLDFCVFLLLEKIFLLLVEADLGIVVMFSEDSAFEMKTLLLQGIFYLPVA